MTTSTENLRPLVSADLEAVVALDQTIFRRSRRGYFVKRVAAALRDPARHIQWALEEKGRLVGYILARVREEEFGRAEATVAFESIGVAAEHRGHGDGEKLIDAVKQVMRRKGIHWLETDARWTDHAVLHFLDHLGFSVAPRLVVSRPVGLALETPDGDAEAPVVVEPQAETDYGAPRGLDYEPLAHDRVPVRSMTAKDLDAIARIDRKVIGRDRAGYLKRKLDEMLNDSAIQVSLVAEVEGIPAGFLMARVDFGEFGHTEPVAVIDTIGVDPDRRGGGIGLALLSQLLRNLAALRVETIETEVRREDFALLGFLYRAGFEPSQRLAFRRRVD